MEQHRNTKIMATVGPVSGDTATLRALVRAGANVLRLNFSHGSHDEHAKVIQRVRALEAEERRPIGLLADLQGPKLRIATFEQDKVALMPGQRFRLDSEPHAGDASRVTLPHPEVFEALAPGYQLLLDDGSIRLEVTGVGADYAETEVIEGGELSAHKGVNVPKAELNLSALTDKDRGDLRFALTEGVDWIALSFVQRPEDLDEARAQLDNRAALLAKIEKPAAVEQLEEVIAHADAVMVARGDLGVELPLEEVPGVQKRIIRSCRHQGKPVVIATQMLDSMVHAASPTRAEASDVAGAAYDGADALMLSNETAMGDYPVEAVQTMTRIVREVERDSYYRALINAQPMQAEATAGDALSSALSRIADILPIAATVTYTTSGWSCQRVARERPDAPILSLTPSLKTARRLTLTWSVHSVHTEDAVSVPDMVEKACRIAKEQGLAASGETLAIIAGMPFGSPGTTNLVRLATLP